MSSEDKNMENTIKRKVNRIGLVGQIVSIILIVLMAVACFGCLLGGIVLAALPNDSITIGCNGDMDITISKDLLGYWLDRIDPGQMNAQMSTWNQPSPSPSLPPRRRSASGADPR